MEKHPKHKEGIPAESSEKSSSEFDSASGSDEDSNISIGCFSIDSLSYESSSQLQEEEYCEIVKVKPTKQKEEPCSTKGATEEANSMQQADTDCSEIRILTTDQCNPEATHQETEQMQLLSHTKIKIPKRLKRQQQKAAAPERAGISQRLRTLQRLVPGGSNMDTVDLLDRVIYYVHLLKLQVKSLEYLCNVSSDHIPASPGFLQSTLPCTYSLDYSKTLDQLHISTLDEETIEPPPSDAMNPLL